MKTKKPQVDGTESISENGEGKDGCFWKVTLDPCKHLNLFVL